MRQKAGTKNRIFIRKNHLSAPRPADRNAYSRLVPSRLRLLLRKNRDHVLLSLLALSGCRSGYELLEEREPAAVNHGPLGGATGSGGLSSGGSEASGGAPSGGATSTGGQQDLPTGGSGGQDFSIGGAPGLGGDSSTGGELGLGGEVDVPDSCPSVVADSVADFSNVQGQAGWTYGYFVPPNLAPDDFIEMSQFGPIENLAEDGWFISADYWTAVSASRMHPNGATTTAPKLSGEQHAVRRFTSSEAGSFVIQGSVYSYNGTFNGTRAYILVEGQQTFELLIPTGQTEAAPFETVVSVDVGDRVDIVLDPFEGADQADSTTFVVKICR